MPKSGVVCHGDCDGIISAFIYIKHYLIDSWPRNVSIVFTQPWRAQIDSRKVGSGLSEVAFLDLAISEEFAKYLSKLAGDVGRLVIIDHHMSSDEYIRVLQGRPNVKIVWRRSSSCPRLMKEVLKLHMNPYEEFLVDVADVCEGSEARSQDVAKLADLIKLSIARNPGDLTYMKHLVEAMLEGKDLLSDQELLSRARIAKFLLRRLLKIMSERSLEAAGTKVVALDLSESRIYAGLLGIAATEFARMSRKDVVLIRREEGKVVVTVRTLNDRAYRICKELAVRLGGRFGGHAEAASATLPDMSLSDAMREVSEVVRRVPREVRAARMRGIKGGSAAD